MRRTQQQRCVTYKASLQKAARPSPSVRSWVYSLGTLICLLVVAGLFVSGHHAREAMCDESRGSGQQTPGPSSQVISKTPGMVTKSPGAL